MQIQCLFGWTLQFENAKNKNRGNSGEKSWCKSNKNAMHIPNKQTFVFTQYLQNPIFVVEKICHNLPSLIYSRDNFLDEVKERKREEKCKEDFLSLQKKKKLSRIMLVRKLPQKSEKWISFGSSKIRQPTKIGEKNSKFNSKYHFTQPPLAKRRGGA